MAPKRTLSFFRHSHSTRKHSNKHVSFGNIEDSVKHVEFSVDRVPQEDQAEVWYTSQEMKRFLYDQAKGVEEEESWLDAHRNVRKVAYICRVQLERSDGLWDSSMTKQLRRVSRSGSKDHRDAAIQRGKNAYKEVYEGRDDDVPKKPARFLRERLPSIGRAAPKRHSSYPTGRGLLTE